MNAGYGATAVCVAGRIGVDNDSDNAAAAAPAARHAAAGGLVRVTQDSKLTGALELIGRGTLVSFAKGSDVDSFSTQVR
eukprot:SAG31_NODE_3009_length_4790_cov_2.862503_5_plen_79_part_00